MIEFDKKQDCNYCQRMFVYNTKLRPNTKFCSKRCQTASTQEPAAKGWRAALRTYMFMFIPMVIGFGICTFIFGTSWMAVPIVFVSSSFIANVVAWSLWTLGVVKLVEFIKNKL